MTKSAFQSAAHHNLRLLCLIRVIPLAGMFFGVWYLLGQNNIRLHWNFIFALLFASVLIPSVTWWRSYRAKTISNGEFLAHLAVDIAVFSLLILNTGGAANPFVSYLLVPLTIAAITLPPSLTWFTGFLCLTAYTLSLFWYVPVPLISPGHGSHGTGHPDSPHLVGMWITFVASAVLIAYFVNRMATLLKEQENSLNRQKQKQLEDDQLLAVASVAASTAHELGTPLNTIKLVLDDWREEITDDGRNPGTVEIDLLRSQIDRCQKTLKKLSGTARSHTERAVIERPVKAYFEELIDTWQVMRPDVTTEVIFAGGREGGTACFHPSLSSSLHNLLNNAGDASPERVTIEVRWTESTATLVIRDYGPGLNGRIAGRAPVESSKPGGMGLGLFLSRSILERHGAGIEAADHPRGGTSVTVVLPLASHK